MLSPWEIALGIVGMGLVTLLTRGFFMFPDEELPLPDWAKQGLRYAPLAALVAVIAPEIVTSQGHLISTFKDARLYATAVGAAYFFWRRGILGTILSGTAVMLVLRIGLGW
ncbi:AzlD domain-containing protein [Roseateles koreensis]|uniref:AzlD domain-containing protein n=1 Tax=Roseateles koreensis TaxID=2987526 RepID=A0ABT5KNU4_9BURK|nr:AzlD domain-containing protein [Roseateles koreensis]MDC8784593.1 AzlD domain-containing protein [Roseateles koreensis]